MWYNARFNSFTGWTMLRVTTTPKTMPRIRTNHATRPATMASWLPSSSIWVVCWRRDSFWASVKVYNRCWTAAVKRSNSPPSTA